MAKFSYQIKSKHDPDSYENILAINQWIKEAIAQSRFKVVKESMEISFSKGNMFCSCNTENEFRKHAFGHIVKSNHYELSFYDKSGLAIDFTVNKKGYWYNKPSEDKNVWIECADEEVLQEIVFALEVKNDGGYQEKIKRSKSLVAYFWEMIKGNLIWLVITSIICLILSILGITRPAWLNL